ncbi:MAG: hypothetical protein WAX69_24090 [Victivallales bacterium]
MGKIVSAKVLLPVLLLLFFLSFESGYAADNPLLKRLEKVEGLPVPAGQIVKLPGRAVHAGTELAMSLKVDYAASPKAKGEESPVHISVSIYPGKGGRIFTDGEGELCLIDKDGKIVLQEKAPLVKLCPT